MDKKLRVYYWLITSYLKKYSLYILFGIFLSVGVWFVIFQILKNFALTKPVKIGMVGNFTKDSIPTEILRKISRGLAKKGKNGLYEADLAKSITIKNDGKIYEIVLKDNIFWHSGQKFTTSDINYNFKDVKFVKKNDAAGYFILKNSYAPFLELLSIPITTTSLNGVGNYRVEKVEWDQEFIKSIYLNGETKIIYRFYPNSNIAFTAFQLGEVNRLENLLSLSGLKIWKKVRIQKQPDNQHFAAIFFNFKGDNITSEKSFRQALSYAINKNIFTEKKAYSSYAFNAPFYTDSVKKYFWDNEAAANLLKKVLGDKKPGKINFTLYSAPEYENYAKQIVRGWNKSLGTAIKERTSNGIPYQWQAYLVISQIPNDPDQYSLWHSNKTFYFSGYRNLKIDKLLEDGRNETEIGKRKEIYAELQKTLTEDLPAIPLFYPWTYTISY